jgi:AraC-like DNA-binding protein
MEQKDISISDVAYESGFGSIRNFNRIFKTHFGITPREYQKR